MTREWQPGDVVVVARMRAFYTDGNEGPMFTFADGSRARADVVPADPSRPLVVIDPEDAEQVERLIRLQDKHFDGYERSTVLAADRDSMQAALREFADPKPPCGASLTLGKDGALYRCSEPTNHTGPHIDGSCTWTAAS